MVWGWLKGIWNQYAGGGPAPDRQTWIRKDGNKVVIVLVHGFSGDAITTWPQFGQLLSKALPGFDVASLRYGTSFLPDIRGVWRADAPISTLALGLAADCSHGELASYSDIVFVAHSMGGLVVQRALVDNPVLGRKTRNVFMFGTPSLGLLKAGPVAPTKPQFADMVFGGEFISDLRKRWSEQFSANAPFRTFAIAGENDQFVPAERALPPFTNQFAIPGDHLQIVKGEKETDAGLQLVIRGLRGDAAPAGPWSAARVAVELGEFQKTIADFGDETKWPGLDADAKVTLALALESVGRKDDAFKLLSDAATKQADADVLGTFAGRLKRRWLLHRQADDAEQSRFYYKRAYDEAVLIKSQSRQEEQRYYHSINLAFFELALDKNREDASKWAETAVAHCNKAQDSLWKSATLGDAALFLGKIDEDVLAHYAAALGRNPEPRQIASIYSQAVKTAELLGRQGTRQKIEDLFRPRT